MRQAIRSLHSLWRVIPSPRILRLEGATAALGERVAIALDGLSLVSAADAAAFVPPAPPGPGPAPAPSSGGPLDANRPLFADLAPVPEEMPDPAPLPPAPAGFLRADRPLSLAERLLAALVPEGEAEPPDAEDRPWTPDEEDGPWTQDARLRAELDALDVRGDPEWRPFEVARAVEELGSAIADPERIAAENAARRRLRDELAERIGDVQRYDQEAAALHALNRQFGGLLSLDEE